LVKTPREGEENRRQPLDSTRWERAVEIFELSLETRDDAREQLIRTEANGDEEIISVVHDMLEADSKASDLIDTGIDRVAFLADDSSDASNDRLTAGDKVGDFEILSELGRGGMGIVYAARDTKLGRVAALKLLPAESRLDTAASDRLIAEAQAASALDHPNVATIYQIGETDDGRRFIAMARYEGETLRERLTRGSIPPREAFSIATQIAHGLSAAHAAGLIHRDVKPENIFLTRQGLAKLLDFGIATLADSAREGPTTRGTVLYMSPEQARREKAGARSDVWSLGVVLYEMLTGSPPYTGNTAEEILKKISDPSPVKAPSVTRRLPGAAAAILARSLEKNPSKRYTDATQLAAELDRAIAEWTRPRTIKLGLAVAAVAVLAIWVFGRSQAAQNVVQEIPELSVLPVTGASTDSESVQLADALGDEIAARVVGLGRVRLVSMPKDTSGISRRRDLHLLRLTVEQKGNQPSVEVTLERAGSSRPEWTTQRSFEKAQLRELGRDVVVGVLQAMGHPVSERERATIGGGFPSSAEAYEKFLQGNRLLAVRTPASVESAVLHYRRAGQLDTTFASAFARQSYAYSLLVDWGWKPTKAFPGDALGEALTLASRATALDSISGDAWLARAYTLVLRDPQHMTGSVEAFQRAITLDPYNAEAFHQYGQTLMALGRYAEALAAYRRVLDLEPDRAMTLVPMAAIHERQHHLGEGLRLLDSAISAAPRVPYARATRSLFRSEAGDAKGAIADAEFGLSLDRNYPVPALSALARALWVSGDTAGALSRVKEAENAVANRAAPTYTESFWLATAEVATGRHKQAVELLGKTQPRGAILWFLFQASAFDKFREDPEVARILSSIDPRLTPQ
jgi:serine/threonine protein kinase